MKKPTIILIALLGAAVLIAGGVLTARQIALSRAIGEDRAVLIACKDAGVNLSDAENAGAKFKFRDGKFVYVASFSANGTNYEYTVNSATGEIISPKEAPPDEPPGSTTTTIPSPTIATISYERAKLIAQTDSGVKEEDTIYYQINMIGEDRKVWYQITFSDGKTIYEYMLDGPSGDIYEKMTTPLDGNIISHAVVIRLVLRQEGLYLHKDEEAQNVHCDLVNEGGRDVYVCVLDRGGEWVPRYEIDARTGKTLDRRTVPQNGTVTLDWVKRLVLGHIGATENDAVFTKTKLENEGGTLIYDIEFTYLAYRLEFKIDASTGIILDEDLELTDENADIIKQIKDTALLKAETMDVFRKEDVTATGVSVKNEDHRFICSVTLSGEDFVYVYDFDALSASFLRSDLSRWSQTGENEWVYSRTNSVMNLKEKVYYDAQYLLKVSLSFNGNSSRLYTWLISLDEQYLTFDKTESFWNVLTDMALGTPENSLAEDASTGARIEPIGSEKALLIAAETAGISSETMSDIECEMEFYDRHLAYEVNFTANGHEYEYKIDAFTGTVLH